MEVVPLTGCGGEKEEYLRTDHARRSQGDRKENMLSSAALATSGTKYKEEAKWKGEGDTLFDLLLTFRHQKRERGRNT